MGQFSGSRILSEMGVVYVVPRIGSELVGLASEDINVSSGCLKVPGTAMASDKALGRQASAVVVPGQVSYGFS